MKKTMILITTLLSLNLAAHQGYNHKDFKNLTPEQKKELKAKYKEKRKAHTEMLIRELDLTPAQQKKLKELQKERHKKKKEKMKQKKENK